VTPLTIYVAEIRSRDQSVYMGIVCAFEPISPGICYIPPSQGAPDGPLEIFLGRGRPIIVDVPGEGVIETQAGRLVIQAPGTPPAYLGAYEAYCRYHDPARHPLPPTGVQRAA
jgi:hypothetical protein